MVGLPRGVAPTVKVNPVTPSGPITTVGVSVGQRVIVNPSQVTPSVLDKAVSQAAPNVNAVVPTVSSPTLSLSVGNQVGSTTSGAASLTNSAVRGVDLNAVVPTAAPTTVRWQYGVEQRLG